MECNIAFKKLYRPVCGMCLNEHSRFIKRQVAEWQIEYNHCTFNPTHLKILEETIINCVWDENINCGKDDTTYFSLYAKMHVHCIYITLKISLNF